MKGIFFLLNKIRCTSHQHHGEEDDEQVGVMPKSEISLHTHILQKKYKECALLSV